MEILAAVACVLLAYYLVTVAPPNLGSILMGLGLVYVAFVIMKRANDKQSRDNPDYTVSTNPEEEAKSKAREKAAAMEQYYKKYQLRHMNYDTDSWKSQDVLGGWEQSENKNWYHSDYEDDQMDVYRNGDPDWGRFKNDMEYQQGVYDANKEIWGK